MSGICIDKLPHSCGTTSGLQVFADPETDKVNGYCYACQTFIPHPYGEEKKVDDVDLPEPKSEQEIKNELLEVTTYRTVDVRKRKLRAHHLELFGVKTPLSEVDGITPTALYFPMTKKENVTGYYVKTLSDPSHQWSIGDVSKCEPFGWKEAKKSGAYRLIITEGREDAVATVAIFDRYGKEEYQPAVIALPNGVNSVKSSLHDLANDIKRMFKEIVIVFDQDEAGEKAGSRSYVVIS